MDERDLQHFHQAYKLEVSVDLTTTDWLETDHTLAIGSLTTLERSTLRIRFHAC